MATTKLKLYDNAAAIDVSKLDVTPLAYSFINIINKCVQTTEFKAGFEKWKEVMEKS